MKQRLDRWLVQRGLVATRSQAESYIKLSQVKVNDKIIKKPGFLADASDKVELTADEQYVSRAALKLASVTEYFKLNFDGKTVLDVGSSTGGFSDFALRHGAARVIAVEVGKNQLHPSLRTNPNIELHEQTDIRDFETDQRLDIVLADVSFISLREILPSVASLATKETLIVVMVKPQFEAGGDLKNKGVIKNDKMRRDILKSFEDWVVPKFVIIDKADSGVAGAKGNRERFYVLRKA